MCSNRQGAPCPGHKPHPVPAPFLSPCLWGAGLPLEEGPAEEELVGALVHAQAQRPVLLCERRPEGEEGEHHVGQALLRGGTALNVGEPVPQLEKTGTRWGMGGDAILCPLL